MNVLGQIKQTEENGIMPVLIDMAKHQNPVIFLHGNMNWNMNVTSHANVEYCVKKLIQVMMGSFLCVSLSV